MTDPSVRTVDCPSGALTVRTWEARSPGWIALIAHGYGEHSGRYQWLAEQLTGARAVVWAPDHVGHGESPGERVLIEDAETLVADLEAVRRVLAQEHPDLPIVLIGHSLGGMLAARHAQQHQDELAALVFSSPVLGTWQSLDLLGEAELPDTGIDPDTLSRDPEVGRAYDADPLVWHGGFRRATLTAIESCLETINEGDSLHLPTLWIHGEEDELVPESDTRTGIDRVRGHSFHERLYPGARHELFNETNRTEVVNDVITFVARELNT